MITRNQALLKIAEMYSEPNLRKSAFVPMYSTGSTPPAAKTAAAGQPPMDPAMAGGDPAAGGQPPMDPAMMQQMLMEQGGGAPAGGPEGQPVPEVSPQGAVPRAEEATENGSFTGNERKMSTNDKLDELNGKVDELSQMVQAMGDMLFSLVSPQDPSAEGGQPVDPAMAGGAPPTDPSMAAGQPPMDPAVMQQMMMAAAQGGGQPPMDPAMAGGQPPMDPAMMPKEGNQQKSMADIIIDLLNK